MKCSYTDHQVAEAVKKSTSVRQVLKLLFLQEAGGNYSTIKEKISLLALDTSHFTGRGWNQKLKFPLRPKRPLIELLVENSRYQSHKLRKRLIKEGYFEEKCYQCNLREWQYFPIPLELEHIDGDHTNNRLENLTLLCPNCHALTATWRGRKMRKATR